MKRIKNKKENNYCISNMASGCIPKQKPLAVLKTMPSENLKEYYDTLRGSEKILNEKLLVEAATKGDLDKVTKLLNDGVSVDAVEYNKVRFYALKTFATPLYFAAANGSVECVKLLLQHGANVNARDRFGATALHMAAEKGHYSCLVALLEAEADCTIATKCSSRRRNMLFPFKGKTTALHLAAVQNHIKCVKELILYGADYNAVDEFGHTSLYLAAQHGYAECVMIHLKNAIGRDILSLPSFTTKDTPLHYVVAYNMVDCVRELLKLGSDPNHKNYIGSTPLHHAINVTEVEELNFEVLKLLLFEGHNADINVTDNAGQTPLHFACFKLRQIARPRPDVTKFLMSYGANVHIKNSKDTTLLEQELQSIDEDYSVLRQVVRCMATVPHLNTMKMTDLIFARANRFENSVTYYPQTPMENNHTHNLASVLSSQMNSYLSAIENSVQSTAVFSQHRPASFERLSELPVVASRVSMDYVNVLTLEDAVIALQDNMKTDKQSEKGAACLEKLTWYENIASNPRTLQHFCRLAIRKSLTAKNLKHVKKLPLPKSFHSYLLMEFDDLM